MACGISWIPGCGPSDPTLGPLAGAQAERGVGSGTRTQGTRSQHAAVVAALIAMSQESPTQS